MRKKHMEVVKGRGYVYSIQYHVNFPQYLYIYTNKHPVVLSQPVFFYDSFNACTILLTLSI